MTRHGAAIRWEDRLFDPIAKFCSRVDYYHQFRPGYPQGLIGLLERECGLTPESLVADIGSGTGLLSQPFLSNGNRVVAIEPGREMRRVAELQFGSDTNFASLDATAEATGLEAASVDMVTVGRALHWFDKEQAIREFRRILRPDGWMVVVRLKENWFAQLLVDYRKLLRRHLNGYRLQRQMKHRQDEWLLQSGFQRASLSHFLTYDLEALIGLTLSLSMAPDVDDPRRQPLFTDLSCLFERYQRDGSVLLEFECAIHYAQLHRIEFDLATS